MTGSTYRSALAAALSLCLACFAPASLAVASDSPVGASLHGRVTGADGVEPAQEVVLALVAPDGETVYRSAPTGETGRFVVDAPAGRYAVLAETDSGAFLASEAVDLENGKSTALSLALQSGPGNGAPSGPANFQVSSGVRSGGFPVWGKWLIVGVIAVGGYFVVDEISEDVEEDATPF